MSNNDTTLSVEETTESRFRDLRPAPKLETWRSLCETDHLSKEVDIHDRSSYFNAWISRLHELFQAHLPRRFKLKSSSLHGPECTAKLEYVHSPSHDPESLHHLVFTDVFHHIELTIASDGTTDVRIVRYVRSNMDIPSIDLETNWMVESVGLTKVEDVREFIRKALTEVYHFPETVLYE